MLGNLGADYKEEELKARAAAERAALANINPDGGHYNFFESVKQTTTQLLGLDRNILGQKIDPNRDPNYHGETAINELQEGLSSAAQNYSNFMSQSKYGRNHLTNLNSLAKGVGRMADYAAAEAGKQPSNPGEALFSTIGVIGRDLENYSKGTADLLGNLKIGGQGIDPRLLNLVTREGLEGLATFGAGNFARRGLRILDKAVPPGGGKLMPVPVGVTDDLMIKPPVTEFKPASVFQVAGNMEAAGWQGPIKSMLNSKVPHEKIAARMAKPYHGALKKGYISMTLEDLAKDKGGWLTRMIGRADDYAQGLRDWRVAKGRGMGNSGLANIQRKFYDNLTENPLSTFKQIYDPANPVRKLLQGAFNTFAGKEWHHIFGNKDAAEFMLSTVAQDPYIAVNLFHFMKKLDLPTSGVPSNIALMSMKPHRGRGVGYHPSRAKKLGFESKGTRKGVLEFSDYGQEISKGILEGTTDINEIFSILEVYSRLNKEERRILKANFKASIISEQGPIMQYIQGVGKKPPNQVLQ